MAIRLRAFIDSNVLANWMLIDGAVLEIGDSATKILREKAGRKFPSYLLLERLRNAENPLPVEFGTSRFAVGETTRVILDEYIKRSIDGKGIPFQYLDGVIKREKLSDKDQNDLYKQILRFLSVFYGKPHWILTWYEEHDFLAVHNLITRTRLSTTDAFLVGQALTAVCTYFVTEDEPLRRSLTQGRRIQAISSQEMFSRLR